MGSRRILKETAVFAGWEAVFCAVMVGILAAVYKFDLAVLFGSVMGFLIAVGYYLSIVICVSIATQKAQAKDVEGSKRLIRLSYFVRMLGTFGILIVCAVTGIFDVLALALPLLFIRPAMAIANAIQKKGAVKHEY